jgi:hypothetical protein
MKVFVIRGDSIVSQDIPMEYYKTEDEAYDALYADIKRRHAELKKEIETIEKEYDWLDFNTTATSTKTGDVE